MFTADAISLLTLSLPLGGAALFLKRSVLPHFLLLLAAALFGVALGARAGEAESALPATLRFVALGSFASVAFYKSGSWIRQRLQ